MLITTSIALIIAYQLQTCYAEDSWSFIVLADPHNAETFASKSEDHKWYINGFAKNVKHLKHLKDAYGGDLTLIPGDTNSGKWHTPAFAKKLGNSSITPKEAVLRASEGCYGTIRKIYEEAGFDQNPMVAIGDHELGGNGWEITSTKTAVLEHFRYGFQKELNRNETGHFLYELPIGNATSTPINTIYNNTSYARKYKNVLFVTIDCFCVMEENFEDREKGLGGEGSVTVSVEGNHLLWFQEVLKEGRKDDSIKHIIVQAHVPVLQPVRKVDSSGQFFDHGSESLFWKLMVQYGVDLYLAGEVHSTTATKDLGSNLLQIASRGNQLNNFLSIEINDQSIDIKAFNEVGTSINGTKDYNQFGHIFVNKSIEETSIESEGVLEILDTNSPLIKFEFEEIFDMASHPVVGLKNKHELVLTSFDVRGVMCNETMINKGVFGEQHNAQVANIDLVEGRRGVSLAGKFNHSSRFAIYAGSAHGGGNIVSYNLWIKTANADEMVLVQYGKVWGDVSDPLDTKDFHLLTLDQGNPTLYVNTKAKLIPSVNLGLNDNSWHHISLSMPNRSCKLSEVILYVDKAKIPVKIPESHEDRNIFHYPGGKLSLGGFGYSSNYESAFPLVKPFTGLMDDFSLYGRPMNVTDLKQMTTPTYSIQFGASCDRSQLINGKFRVFMIGKKGCKRKCAKLDWCAAYEFSKNNGQKQCTVFDQTPNFGVKQERTQCALVVG